MSRQLTESPQRAVAIIPEHEPVSDSDEWAMVVGVDGSTGSSRAIRWAGAAARDGNGSAVAVHAYESPVADLRRDEERTLFEESRARLEEEWCAPLRHLGVPYRTVIKQGDPRAVIRSVAETERSACVVVGSRGLGPVSQRLLGSVTFQLIRELSRPTVVIPSPRDCVDWTL